MTRSRESKTNGPLTAFAIVIGFVILIYVMHLARGPERHPDRTPCPRCGR